MPTNVKCNYKPENRWFRCNNPVDAHERRTEGAVINPKTGNKNLVNRRCITNAQRNQMHGKKTRIENGATIPMVQAILRIKQKKTLASYLGITVDEIRLPYVASYVKYD